MMLGFTWFLVPIPFWMLLPLILVPSSMLRQLHGGNAVPDPQKPNSVLRPWRRHASQNQVILRIAESRKMNTQPKNQRAELTVKSKAELRKKQVKAFSRRYAFNFRRITFSYND